ncbi:MAG: hypothetical protein P4L16_02200 [Chlamydiales bacterium]|nr:hypothetical protein [Chlamydiales bacterium]
MLKFKHSTLIVVAGLIWMAVGVYLLNMGLRLISEKALQHMAEVHPTSLLSYLAAFAGGIQEASVVLIALAMLIGYFKGRYVLAKTVHRMVARIREMPSPVALHRIYGARFYVLIAIMMGLGMLIRFFDTPADIRGAVDVIIGSALVNGALLYFRQAAEQPKKQAVR